MPSTYAHYRFGMELLPTLSPRMQRSIDRFLPLYQVGLHGPDPFYFYSPLSKTYIGSLGDRYHRAPGRVLFEEAALRLDFAPSEAATVYLWGVLAHFCLDRLCHPPIHRWADEGRAAHPEIETEFDRYLLEKDGKCPPRTQPIGRHIRLRPAELPAAAEVYDRVSPAQLHRCLTNMRAVVQLAQAKCGWRRTAADKLLGLAGDAGRCFIMHDTPNPRCSWANEPLYALYQQALLDYPGMLEALQNYVRDRTPLGPEFDLIFG